MRKTYIKPSVVVYGVNVEGVMNQACSIQNIEGDTQTPIEKNDKDGFEAGAKPHYNPWTTWDD